jgi:hypothetical protein
MYNFIFWFFYKFFEWRKGFQSFFISGTMVAFAVIIHLLLLYNILRYFTGFTIPYFSGNYGQRKLILLPMVIVLFFMLYFGYYKNKGEGILLKYEGKKFSNSKNIIFIIFLLVVPLIIVIKLSNIATIN